ncbi:MAG TPA: helix-turn-helix transcriptional regulator [Rhizomicrobium sp.]|nr:helix-turn-helix transcriptional regulator [Rhizomicrobium sp.]
MAKREKVTYSESSAFHALGLPDADDLVLRAELMRRIVDIIAARRISQVEAGKLMGMDQPRVSALKNGRIGKFSTDRLLKALSDLGQDIEVRITPSRVKKGRLRVAA